MKDGKWSVVAALEHRLGDGVQVTPLPVTHLRFDSEAEAHAFGMTQAREHLARGEAAA